MSASNLPRAICLRDLTSWRGTWTDAALAGLTTASDKVSASPSVLPRSLFRSHPDYFLSLSSFWWISMSLFLAYCLTFSAVALVCSRATHHRNHRNPLTTSLVYHPTTTAATSQATSLHSLRPILPHYGKSVQTGCRWVGSVCKLVSQCGLVWEPVLYGVSFILQIN